MAYPPIPIRTTPLIPTFRGHGSKPNNLDISHWLVASDFPDKSRTLHMCHLEPTAQAEPDMLFPQQSLKHAPAFLGTTLDAEVRRTLFREQQITPPTHSPVLENTLPRFSAHHHITFVFLFNERTRMHHQLQSLGVDCCCGRRPRPKWRNYSDKQLRKRSGKDTAGCMKTILYKMIECFNC